MMLRPTWSLSLPKPFGNRLLVEFSMIQAEFIAEAQRKITPA